MKKKAVHVDDYVIVNVWTSDKNKALQGANVGHVSLTTKVNHISLWPGVDETSTTSLKNRVRHRFASFFGKPSQYEENYEQDCLRETQSESGEYEFCLNDYGLCISDDGASVSVNNIYLKLISAYPFTLDSEAKEKLYLECDAEGTLSYSFTDAADNRVNGTLSSQQLKVISEKLSKLKAPLTKKELDHLEAFSGELIQSMPEAHRNLIGQKIQCTLKTPSGSEVKEIIHEEIFGGTVETLLTMLKNEDSEIWFRDYLQKFLLNKGIDLIKLKAHTRWIESRKIYFELTSTDELQYKVKTPSKEVVTGVINKADLCSIAPMLGRLRAPLTSDQLRRLEMNAYKILKITATRGHTKEVLFRPISHGAVAEAGEVLYRINNNDNTYKSVAKVPLDDSPDFRYEAIKLLHANFRVVLYSLTVDRINNEIEYLKNGAVSGWSIQGSNFLSRNYSTTTTESCSSLAYRCLNAGGMYSELQCKVSSQTSSIATPDDLLRHVVAFKERELISCPETSSFVTQGINLSSLKKVKEAYARVGGNANAESDWVAVIPTLSRCSIQ